MTPVLAVSSNEAGTLEAPPVRSAAVPLARMEVAPEPQLVAPALKFVSETGRSLGADEESLRSLCDSVRGALELLISRAAEGAAMTEDPLAVEVAFDGARGSPAFEVRLLNRGAPILNVPPACPTPLVLENLGRLGQRLVARIALPAPAGSRKFSTDTGFAISGVATDPNAELCIRPLREGEEQALSELFFHVYGYHYIAEWVYFPEKLSDALRSGELISVVGTLKDRDGRERIVGHVALRRWNTDPLVYEPCLGVVDPRVKSRGIFKEIFAEVMRRADELPIQYHLFDFVTNHDFSQKMVAAYGSVETGIFVGCQSADTQARLSRLGLGEDPKEMDRYTILYGVLPRVAHPFGSHVALPETIAGPFGFVLEALGLSWAPVSRFDALPDEGSFDFRALPAQSSVHYNLRRPGRAAVERIVEDWRRHLREGAKYVSVDVPLGTPGLGLVRDILASHGFFAAGFLPWKNSSRLAFRFQAIAPTRVAFDKIRVHTPIARRLLEVIRQDCERNCLV